MHRLAIGFAGALEKNLKEIREEIFREIMSLSLSRAPQLKLAFDFIE
jgi:hypothetical protein